MADEVHRVYRLEQHVRIMTRENEEEPRVEESFDRVGLIMLTSSRQEGVWRRYLKEYLSNDQFLDTLRGRMVVARSSLSEPHDKATENREIQFDPDFGIAVQSDLLNTNVHEFGTDDAPSVPCYGFYMPTLSPVLPAAMVKAGGEWKAQPTLSWAAGDFQVAYTVKLVGGHARSREIEMSFDAMQSDITVGVATLRLRPEGSWKVVLDDETGLPTESSGAMRFVVNAQYLNDDDEVIDVEILDYTTEFEWSQVPVMFDDENLFCASWTPGSDRGETASPDDGDESGDGAEDVKPPETTTEGAGPVADSKSQRGGSKAKRPKPPRRNPYKR